MAKMLMIYPDRCTGCQNCVLSCSFHHDSEFRPYTSRIHVHNWEIEGAPECVTYCPTSAIEFVEETDAARARKKAVATGFKKTFEEVR